MARQVKLHNPGRLLQAVNPFGKAAPTRRRRKTNPKRKTTRSPRNPSRVRSGALRNPDVTAWVLRGIAAFAGATITTWAANLVPLPNSKVFNIVAKFVIAIGAGEGLRRFGGAKAAPYADFFMAGGLGVAVGDAWKHGIPMLRTKYLGSQEEVEAAKEMTNNQVGDVVVEDALNDVVDSMPYYSAWSQYQAA